MRNMTLFFILLFSVHCTPLISMQQPGGTFQSLAHAGLAIFSRRLLVFEQWFKNTNYLTIDIDEHKRLILRNHRTLKRLILALSAALQANNIPIYDKMYIEELEQQATTNCLLQELVLCKYCFMVTLDYYTVLHTKQQEMDQSERTLVCFDLLATLFNEPLVDYQDGEKEAFLEAAKHLELYTATKNFMRIITLVHDYHEAERQARTQAPAAAGALR